MPYPLERERRDQVVIVKVSASEKAEIEAKADAHSKGNISHWIRAASIRYTPPAVDTPR